MESVLFRSLRHSRQGRFLKSPQPRKRPKPCQNLRSQPSLFPPSLFQPLPMGPSYPVRPRSRNRPSVNPVFLDHRLMLKLSQRSERQAKRMVRVRLRSQNSKVLYVFQLVTYACTEQTLDPVKKPVQPVVGKLKGESITSGRIPAPDCMAHD